MKVILDVEIPHAFWGSLEVAKRRGMVEAANTGGILLEVRAIEIRGSVLVFVGTIPMGAIEKGPKVGQGRVTIRSRGLGTFHTTWGALMRPEDTVGFFVLQRPVTGVGGRISNELDTLRVAMEVKRRFGSMSSSFIGPVCCVECNEAISEQRLKIIPGVRTCTNCQHIKEGTKK